MRVRLMKRKGKKGTTLFLRWWNNGDKKYVHEFMRFHLSNEEGRREEDKELLRQADLKRIEKEQELTSQNYGIGKFNRRKTPFITYFESVIKNKGWHAVQTHLNNFPRKNTPVCDLDETWLNDFKNYLLSLPKVKTSSANRYYAIMKACLNVAVREKVLLRNPSTDVEPIPSPSKPVTSLTMREVETLAATTPLTITKRAFLFGCLTGLRYSDIKDLTYNDINWETKEIIKTQKKTGNVVVVPLVEDAITLMSNTDKILTKSEKKTLRQIKDAGIDKGIITAETRVGEWARKTISGIGTMPDSLVFPDLPNPQKVNKELKTWNKLIYKRMHFHLSRSTYASLAYEKTNDLYAVSKLLGHRRVATTEKYLNITSNKLRGVVENSVGMIKIFKD